MATARKGSPVRQVALVLPETIDNSIGVSRPTSAQIGSPLVHQSRTELTDRKIFDIRAALRAHSPELSSSTTKKTGEESSSKLFPGASFDDSHLDDSLSVKSGKSEHSKTDSVQNSLFQLADDGSVQRYLRDVVKRDFEREVALQGLHSQNTEQMLNITTINDEDIGDLDDDEDDGDDDRYASNKAGPSRRTKVSGKDTLSYKVEVRFNNLSQWVGNSREPKITLLQFKLTQDIMIRESQLLHLWHLIKQLDRRYWQYAVLRIKHSTDTLIQTNKRDIEQGLNASLATIDQTNNESANNSANNSASKPKGPKIIEAQNAKLLVAKRNRILLLQNELGTAIALYRDVTATIVESITRLRGYYKEEVNTPVVVSLFWNNENHLLKMNKDVVIFSQTLTARMWLGFQTITPLLTPPVDFSDVSFKDSQDAKIATYESWFKRHKDKCIKDKHSQSYLRHDVSPGLDGGIGDSRSNLNSPRSGSNSSNYVRSRANNALLMSVDRRFILENLRLSTPPSQGECVNHGFSREGARSRSRSNSILKSVPPGAVSNTQENNALDLNNSHNQSQQSQLSGNSSLATGSLVTVAEPEAAVGLDVMSVTATAASAIATTTIESALGNIFTNRSKNSADSPRRGSKESNFVSDPSVVRRLSRDGPLCLSIDVSQNNNDDNDDDQSTVCSTGTTNTANTKQSSVPINELSMQLNAAFNNHFRQPIAGGGGSSKSHRSSHPKTHLPVIYSSLNLADLPSETTQFDHNLTTDESQGLQKTALGTATDDFQLEQGDDEWIQLRDYCNYSWYYNQNTQQYEQINAAASVNSTYGSETNAAFWNNLTHNPLVVEAAIGFPECSPVKLVVPQLPDQLRIQCAQCEYVIAKESEIQANLASLEEQSQILKQSVSEVANEDSVYRISEHSLMHYHDSTYVNEVERLKLRQQGSTDQLVGISVDYAFPSVFKNTLDTCAVPNEFQQSLYASQYSVTHKNNNNSSSFNPGDAFLTGLQNSTSVFQNSTSLVHKSGSLAEKSSFQVFGSYIDTSEIESFRIEKQSKVKQKITSAVDDARRMVDYSDVIPTVRTDLKNRRKEISRTDPKWFHHNATIIQCMYRRKYAYRRVKKLQAHARFVRVVMVVQTLLRGFLGKIRAKKAARKLKLDMFLLRKEAIRKFRASLLITKCVRRLIELKQQHADDPYKSPSKFIARSQTGSRKEKRKKFSREGQRKAGIARQTTSRENDDNSSGSPSTSPLRSGQTRKSSLLTMDEGADIPITKDGADNSNCMGTRNSFLAPPDSRDNASPSALVSTNTSMLITTLQRGVSQGNLKEILPPGSPTAQVAYDAAQSSRGTPHSPPLLSGVSMGDMSRGDDHSVLSSNTGNNISLRSFNENKAQQRKNNKAKNELSMIAADAEKMNLNAKMEALALVKRVNRGKIKLDTVYNSRLIPMRKVPNISVEKRVKRFAVHEHAFLKPPSGSSSSNSGIGSVAHSPIHSVNTSPYHSSHNLHLLVDHNVGYSHAKPSAANARPALSHAGTGLSYMSELSKPPTAIDPQKSHIGNILSNFISDAYQSGNVSVSSTVAGSQENDVFNSSFGRIVSTIPDKRMWELVMTVLTVLSRFQNHRRDDNTVSSVPLTTVASLMENYNPDDGSVSSQQAYQAQLTSSLLNSMSLNQLQPLRTNTHNASSRSLKTTTFGTVTAPGTAERSIVSPVQTKSLRKSSSQQLYTPDDIFLGPNPNIRKVQKKVAASAAPVRSSSPAVSPSASQAATPLSIRNPTTPALSAPTSAGGCESSLNRPPPRAGANRGAPSLLKTSFQAADGQTLFHGGLSARSGDKSPSSAQQQLTPLTSAFSSAEGPGKLRQEKSQGSMGGNSLGGASRDGGSSSRDSHHPQRHRHFHPSHTEKLEARAKLKSEMETIHMKNVLRNYF